MPTPPSIRVSDRMSSTRRDMRRDSARIRPAKVRISPSGTMPLSRSSAYPEITCRGVLSSWEAFAVNSCRIWDVFSSSSRSCAIWTRCSSRRCRRGRISSYEATNCGSAIPFIGSSGSRLFSGPTMSEASLWAIRQVRSVARSSSSANGARNGSSMFITAICVIDRRSTVPSGSRRAVYSCCRASVADLLRLSP